MLRFGIIGAGVIGGVHARTLARLPGRATLVAVAGRSPDRARALAAEHGCDWHATARELLARPDLDAVCVCVPSGLHAGIGEAALRAGKHVLVEKPLEVSLAAADRLIGTARSTGRTLGVVLQHRFDPAARYLYDAVRAGTLGALTSAHAEVPWWRSQGYYDSGRWRGTARLDGGGAVMNQGIHTLDLLGWVMGEAVEVTAHTALLAHRGLDVEDTAAAVVRFANGALATVLATTAAYPGRTARLAVHGTRGSAVLDDDRMAYFHARTDGESADPYGAYGAGDRSAGLPLRYDDERDPTGMPAAPHRDQLADFCDAVEHGRPPAVGGQEARRSLALTLALYESARTGRTVRPDGTRAP
ncbi:Gfo/Idh/MocA family oxidoreductase [Kitasatospora sp. NPDC048540]|uniref:Gfo/Idh/MocA family protein n=1 Tax=Kitasatospora sp. NPDC048540 TaxID=3155634 RepID=UPI0033F5FAB7